MNDLIWTEYLALHCKWGAINYLWCRRRY